MRIFRSITRIPVFHQKCYQGPKNEQEVDPEDPIAIVFKKSRLILFTRGLTLSDSRDY